MKRIVIFFTAAAFVVSLVTNAFGVEKKEKQETPKTEVKADSTAQKKEASGADLPKKKYDDFIDLNKNGKDDRYENRKPKSAKSAPARLIQDKPAEKKPVPAVPKKEEKKEDASAKKPN